MKEKLFLLLRYAVCGNAEPDREQVEKELAEIYSLAKKHDMAQTVAYACDKLGIESSQMSKEKAVSIFRTEKIIFTANSIGDMLEKAEIPHIFLKGHHMRSLYPENWLRPSCDVDVYVGEENVEKAAQALEAEGFIRGRRHIYDIMFKSPNGCTAELHFLLTDGDGNKKTSAVLNRVWDYTVRETDYRYRMNEEMFYFYHVAHMAKHIRSGGCGIRPFLDMWLLCNKQKDRTKTDTLLKEGGLLTFEKYARQLSLIWFSDEPHDRDSRILEEYVLSGAVYGNKHNAAAGQGGKTKYILSRIFMPYSQLKYKYPGLSGRPYLMLFYTVRRWFNLLKGTTAKHSVDELKASCSVSGKESAKFGRLLKKFEL